LAQYIPVAFEPQAGSMDIGGVENRIKHELATLGIFNLIWEYLIRRA
jgi:hypothetical protein